MFIDLLIPKVLLPLTEKESSLMCYPHVTFQNKDLLDEWQMKIRPKSYLCVLGEDHQLFWKTNGNIVLSTYTGEMEFGDHDASEIEYSEFFGVFVNGRLSRPIIRKD